LLDCSYALQRLCVVNVRPFNHSGPGHSEDLLLPTLVQQFAGVTYGRCEPVIRLGNLDTVRDLSDADLSHAKLEMTWLYDPRHPGDAAERARRQPFSGS
jgi:GDP-4-dehydro-6-deoxy-D-mannose reductase